MRPWRTDLRPLAAAAVAVLVLASAAGADRVRTTAGIGYPGTITGVTDKGLEVRVGGTRRIVPFNEIRSVSADDYPRLEEAEELFEKGAEGAAAAMKKAAELYDDLLTPRAPAWLRTIVQWRMYDVYARSGQVQKALDAYLDMAEKSPRLVSQFDLPQPEEGEHEANKAMLEQVDAVLRKNPAAPYADALKEFRVALLLLEGDPKEILASGALEKLLESDDPKVRTNAMLRKLELLLAVNRVPEAAEWLEKIRASDAQVFPPEMTYWTGRVLDAQNKPVEAALAYMRLPILHPNEDPNRTAEALWRTGKALEAAEAPPAEAKAVYQEAVNDYPDTTGAQRAKRELIRIGAK
ncbi:MAG: tetratricopeptide repeat protein [Phycisphaerae bacterium]